MLSLGDLSKWLVLEKSTLDQILLSNGKSEIDVVFSSLSITSLTKGYALFRSAIALRPFIYITSISQ